MLYENHLIFEDIEPAFSTFTYSNFSNHFYYSPQAKIDYSENIEIAINENHTFSILEEFLSANDQFQWYKEGIKIEGETNSTIYFSPVTKADSGTYHLEITNPEVPDLILKSHNKSLYVTNVSEAGVPLSEYNALVDFYYSLDGDNWTRNDNWLDTINHSVGDWYGITVEDGHVIQIYFDAYERYNLNGSLPNSIKNLTELKALIIVTDNVRGELPPGLFELVNLEILNIAECEISGNLPPEIGNLTKLKSLGLEANLIEGTIPPEIGNLTNLKFISFYENQLSGEIPNSISQLVNLYYLGLAYNNLSGTIPSDFGNLIELKYLLLSNNQLVGPLPVELSDLTKIIMFTINNNLIGTIENSNKSANLKSTETENYRQIPDKPANLIQMDTLYLGNNNLQFNDIEAIFS